MVPVTRCLLIGECGAGKSSLILSLCPDLHLENPPKDKVVKVGIAARGVTKDVTMFHTEINGKPFLIGDMPGVGDKDVTLEKMIGLIEAILDKAKLNCLIFANQIPQFRNSMGTQIVAMIINKGLLDHAGDVSKHIVICGTRRDMVDEEQIGDWRKEIVADLEKDMGFEPGSCHVATTSVKKSKNSQVPTNIEIDELKAALCKVPSTELGYQAPTAEKLYDGLSKITGIKLKSRDSFARETNKERDFMGQQAMMAIKSLESQVQSLVAAQAAMASAGNRSPTVIPGRTQMVPVPCSIM